MKQKGDKNPLLTVLLLILLLGSVLLVSIKLPVGYGANGLSNGDGIRLRLQVIPEASRMAADGNTHPVYVEIETEDGKPAFTPVDLNVSVFSSHVDVGDIMRQIVIPKGRTFAIADFYSTGREGSTDVTALASGYAPGIATLQFASPVGIPSKLAIYLVPSRLVPEQANSTVIVQLQDQKNRPARASADLPVFLTSSDPQVGSVDSNVTIKQGTTYGEAKFFGTFAAGPTRITAFASGYETGSAVMLVEGTIPQKLVVFANPPTIPSVAGSDTIITVQLQNENGAPAKAPTPVDIILTSSNRTVGSLQSDIMIKAGETYGSTRFIDQGIPGLTQITAAASGYVTGSATIKAVEPGSIATKLCLFTAPARLLPDERIHNSTIVVQLLNETGYPVIATTAIPVHLSSSNVAVGAVDQTIIIYPNRNYEATSFATTYRVGVTILTASQTGLSSAEGTLRIDGAVPERIVIRTAPNAVPATGVSYRSVLVELEDLSGNLAKAPMSIPVSLSLSNPEIGSVDQYVDIPAGQTYVIAPFQSTMITGTSNITTSASGLLTGISTISTVEPYPSKLVIRAIPAHLNAMDMKYPSLIIQLQDAEGTPAMSPQAITVSLSSSKPSVGKTDDQVVLKPGNAYTVAEVATSQAEGEFLITATASGYSSSYTTVSAFLFPVSLDLVAPETAPVVGQNCTLHISASSMGLPILSAPIKWLAASGSAAQTSMTDLNGSASWTYQPVVPGLDRITASLILNGFQQSNTTLTYKVDAKVTLYVRLATASNTSIPNAEVKLQPVGQKTSSISNKTGVAVFNDVKWGKVSLQVPQVITGVQGVRYLFKNWSDGKTTYTRNETLMTDRQMQANYATQYHLTISSAHGDVQLDTWLDAGTRINFGISSQTVTSSLLDQYVFAGWSGDYQGKEPTISIVMDSPKMIQAVWEPSNDLKLYATGGVVAVCGIISVIYLKVRKKKKVDATKWDEVDYDSISLCSLKNSYAKFFAGYGA